MKKPAKFSNYVAALMFGVCTYSEDLASNIFSSVFGLNDDEVNDCSQYLDYIVDTNNLVEQKTCHIECFCHSALYDSYKCDACGIELTESITVVGFDWKYCPNCGAKVVE